MISKLILLGATVVGAIIFFLVPGLQALVGPGIIILAWLIALIFTIPHKSSTTRGQWALWACFVLITAIATSITFLYIQESPLYLTSGNLNLQIEVNPKIISFMIGLFIGVVGAVILFALVGYFSSIYVLSLHEEGLTFKEAFRSFILLILNKQYMWLKVEDGEKIEVKEKGYNPNWLSRGKIMIRAGNAIALQKGGTITRIEGPGTIVTEKNEEIKQIFDLGGQSVLNEVTNAITSDRIPLTIKVRTNYRLKPSENPNAPDVIKEKNFGFFPVDRETLRKAVFSSKSGLEGFAKGATEGQLRDQIMAHRFNELFEVEQGTSQDLVIRVNSRRIKMIEDTIKAAINGFASNGVEIVGIDIAEIILPPDILEAISMGIKSKAEAEAIEEIEEKRNHARGEMVEKILSKISEQIEGNLGDAELTLAAMFAQISRRTFTDDVLGHEYIKMLEKLASGEGMKIFNATPSQSSIESEHLPLSLPPRSSRGTGHNGNGNGKS